MEKVEDYQEEFKPLSISQRIKNLQTSEIIGLSGLLLLFLGLAAFLIISSKSEPSIEIISPDEVDTESNSKVIFVDVSGAVEKPGLYQLNSQARLNDALVAAGGLSLFADREWVAKNINLAAFLKDGQKIYIKPINQSEAKNIPTSEFNQQPLDKININTASLAELQKLKGVGPATAQKIIDYREREGNFSQIEDIMKVPGIGEKTFENFKDKISVW